MTPRARRVQLWQIVLLLVVTGLALLGIPSWAGVLGCITALVAPARLIRRQRDWWSDP